MLETLGEILVWNVYIQDTAKMLSHQIAINVYMCRLSTAYFSTIQCMNISISSRSDIDRRPFLFGGKQLITNELGLF